MLASGAYYVDPGVGVGEFDYSCYVCAVLLAD